MTRRRLVRNFGTVCVGTVLLGLGSRAGDGAPQENGLAFDQDDPPPLAPLARKPGLPRPGFGPLFSPVGPSAGPSPGPSLQGPAADEAKIVSSASLRAELRASASDGALAAAPLPSMVAPPLPVPTVAAPPPSQDLATGPARALAEPMPQPAFGPLATADLPEPSAPGAAIEPPLVLALAAPRAVPVPPLAPPFTLPPSDSVEAMPAPAAAGDAGLAELAVAAPPPPPPPPVEVDGNIAPLAQPERAGTALASLDSPAPARRSIPPRNAGQGGGAASREATNAVAAISAAPAITDAQSPPGQAPLTRTGSEQALPDQAVSTHDVAPLTPPASSAPGLTAGVAPGLGDAVAEAASPPSLAALVPPPRAAGALSIPMATSLLPPPPQVTAAANDDGDQSNTAMPAMPTSADVPGAASLVMPAARSRDTLGLGQNPPPATPATGEDVAALQGGARSPFTASAQPPQISYDDELILEVKIDRGEASDTLVAYGTRKGIYLPLGTLMRVLDLAITVSDEGHFASGWVLAEDRTLTFDLRNQTVTVKGVERPLLGGEALAFEGELYLHADRFAEYFPLKVETDLRSQSVLLATTEPFPFQERLERETQRKRLALRGGQVSDQRWPRQETPWRMLSLPLADLELRAVSDSMLGPRGEADLRLAGDLAFMTAQTYFSGNSRDGLTASLIELGRRDADADLLGPLKASEFMFGDVATYSMPVGLRGASGRGLALSNAPLESVSVFDKIDLRGILPDGFEVELYRNDILVGSTRDAINGQYEFLQTPVDYGLNVFRLVFYGPQGQRREEVRRVSVGDGRLSQGQFVYRFGAVQKDANVLGVRDPRYIRPADFGAWRASGEIAYGVSSGVTAVASGAWFETRSGDKWLASAGLRSSLGAFAVKADVALSDGKGFAAIAGIGGRLGSGAFTISHGEYGGDFLDETRSFANGFLRRSTELDFNTSVTLGDEIAGTIIPLTLRARRAEFANGQSQLSAALRGSARLSSFQISNTLEYSQTSLAGAQGLSQLFGEFDLATTGQAKTRGRLSLGYRVLPEPELVSAALEVDHAIDQDTALHGSISYGFQDKSTRIGLSAVRDFDRFTLALDSNYGFADKSYAVALRLGVSFGRDPLRGGLFLARPGLASSGGVALRAFQDRDGDAAYGPSDTLLPDVEFAAFNQTATTGPDGIARLSGLGNGGRVSVQVDPTTLPDIALAPVTRGIEIVPRAGRIHSADFAVVALSEVEGTAFFADGGTRRGVSGVRLELVDASGKPVVFAKTELDGYFFFEQVPPGRYTIRLDPGQSERLGLCFDRDYAAQTSPEPDIVRQDVTLERCE